MFAALKIFAKYQLYQLERNAKKSKNTIKETLAENYVFYVMIKATKKCRRKLHNLEVDNVLKFKKYWLQRKFDNSDFMKTKH